MCVSIITFQAKIGLIALKITVSLLMVQLTSQPKRGVGFQLHASSLFFSPLLPTSFTSSLPTQASFARGFCGAERWLFSQLRGKRKNTPFSAAISCKFCGEILTDTGNKLHLPAHVQKALPWTKGCYAPTAPPPHQGAGHPPASTVGWCWCTQDPAAEG